jgi:GT2 family glycosyltransferase
MEKQSLVSIIIVNWNGLKWLPDCLGSLEKQNYTSYEIVFVDNASKDGSVSWVRTHYPRTKIIINRKNLGFAGANNVGYRKAGGEYVLFLNNDTRVTKAFLTELVNVLKTDKVIGGVQSKILLMDHPDTHDSVGAFLTPSGFLYHYGFGRKNKSKYDKQIDLYTAKGACMMFRKSVLNEVAVDGNIFDPDYFAYFEESDMCHRVWLAGYRIVYAYKSVIYHKMGATSASMNNAFIQYHSFKNRIRTYLKNLGPKWFFTIVPIHILLCEFYAIIAVLRGNITLGLAIERALLWNMTHLGDTLRLRRVVQKKIRLLYDSQIASAILRKPSASYYLGLLSGRVEE